jgi:hypothetical protein
MACLEFRKLAVQVIFLFGGVSWLAGGDPDRSSRGVNVNPPYRAASRLHSTHGAYYICLSE